VKGKETIEERHAWLACLTRRVKPAKIIEFGCGSGFVLERLSHIFPSSVIIGVDKLPERLHELNKKKLSNVIPLCADFTKLAFPENTFNTVLFVASLHEVFSYKGIESIRHVITNAHRILQPRGMLIIQDFVKPDAQMVELRFRNEETRMRFRRFRREFKPRKIKSKKTEAGVEIDIADAVEFISKYRSPSEADWKEEMHETHFFFTRTEFIETVEKIGFQVIEAIPLPKRAGWWNDKRTGVAREIEFDFKTEYRWTQLTCRKNKEGKKKKE
jgi:ubiquinone/menaquinone biosynthesis C-methylase UbiE